jgi:serine/threonine protein kinase
VDEVVFGRYRLLSVIGAGGMGKVYKAHDTMMDRDVAIKVLPSELATEPGYEQRFRREAQIAARLNEPHIIPIHETGEIEGQLYLVMPIIEGTDVHGLLQRDGPMSPQRAVHIIEQLAAALDAAHAVGLVHRDIKPSNALVTGNDFVYLIDFGIAHDAAATKLTSTGMIVGTMAYMAPERFTAGVSDARSDVYALACVLHECLTGAPPYPGDSMEQQIAGHLTLGPPKPSAQRPELPVGFDDVIATGMAKDPDKRYQSAHELASAAQHALTTAPAGPPQPVASLDATRPAPAPAPVDDQVSPSPPRAAQKIDRAKLGPRTKIGQGGQGVVYRAPNVKTKFAASMVYKEYKASALAEMDFTALAAMPALVEQSLSYAQAERLVSIAAWPCALVEDSGAPTGFVMPAIPDEFFISLKTVKGVSSTTAEFQHLLNHSSVLEARGIALDDVQRYTLLREVASGLAFLHRHGVCVGDISPKNLLFSLSPHEAVYFIDCDAMRINGVSTLPQVETPGWDTPAGEELATIYSDAYKLGLLALRLLAGSQDTTNTGHIPSTTPGLLRQVITDTVTNEPSKRPLPEAWTYVLGHAIEKAQHLKLVAPRVAAPVSAAPTPPPTPVVRSRPPVYSAPPVLPSAPPIPVQHSRPPTPPWAPPASQPASSKAPIWIGVGLATLVVAALVVFMVALANRNNDTPSSSSGATYTTTYASGASVSPSYSAPAPSTANTPTVRVTPPLAQGLDPHQVSCAGYQLPGRSGWATAAGRGSATTSCQFAANVINAYYASYPVPSRDSRQVIAPGSISCPSAAAGAPMPVMCSGNDFVMSCVVNGNDPWITCTGGNDAVVYLY